MKNKLLIILVSVAVVLIALTIGLSSKQQQELKDTVAGDKIFPGLAAKVNQVAKVEIQYLGQTTNIALHDGKWVLLEKSNYAADFSQVKRLVLALADLKIVEAKTRKPENYERLGVQDITKDGKNKLISLFDSSGKAIVQLILGNLKGDDIFVRRVNDAQAWLAAGRVDTPANQAGWLDKQIVDIDSKDIKSFEILHRDKDKLVATRKSRDDKDFQIELPKGKELKSHSALNSLARNLTKLNFTDLEKMSELKLTKADKTSSRYSTFDGLVISLDIYKLDEKDYLVIKAAASSDASDQIKQQVQNLNARWLGWAYQIPGFKANALVEKKSELLK